MKTRGIIIGLLGVWLILAGFLPLPAIIEIWSTFITGVLIALLGFSLGRYSEGRHWVCGIAGLWLIVSAFVPGLHNGTGLLTNNVVGGLVVAIAGFSVPAAHKPGELERRRVA